MKTLKTLTLWILPIALTCCDISERYVKATAVAVDGEGNVYLTGYFGSSTINFGGGDLENAGKRDIFLAKFDRDGRHVWSKRFGGEGWDRGRALAVDGEGNVYLTGDFDSSTINFGGGDLKNAGGRCSEVVCSDIFLAKFDKYGRHVWSTTFGGDGDDVGQAVAVDGEGNVYLTGYFESRTINFGGGGLGNAGGKDVFLAKFDKDGRRVWSKTFGGDGDDVGQALAVDGEGNVYLTGHFYSSTINFGGGDLENASGQCDVFLAKFDEEGRHVWSESFWGNSVDLSWALAVDGAGNVYLTGDSWSDIINFGGEYLKEAGDVDVFLAKFDKEGRHVWSKRFGGGRGDEGNALAVDGEGNVYLTGYFESRTINFGGEDLKKAGDCDAFLAKFDKYGRHVWSKSFGGDDEDAGHSLAVDGEGNVYLTGYFWSSTINFGGEDLKKAGDCDAFLAKFDKYGRHVWSKRFGGD